MTLKVIAAPDKFKGSCPADKAAAAIARGWLSIYPEDDLVLVPVADGGEGTLDAMAAACGGTTLAAKVLGPMGRPVDARWLLLANGAAMIEMAQASGLNLVGKAERDVRLADTFGTGQLIREALDRGCNEILIGIGGSATNDGGMGMLRALGVRFLASGEELTAPGDLCRLDTMDFTGFDSRIRKHRVTVASDVANPLCGEHGASAVFGPQKGASPQDVLHMDACLRRLAGVTSSAMGFDLSGNPGSGAAGGLGWALMQCCGAALRPGIDVVLDAVGFDAELADASLVITGEGSLDAQTALGKVPAGIAKRALTQNVPVAVIAGTLGPGHDEVYKLGIGCAIGITPGPMPLEEAMVRAEELIGQAAARLARIVRLGRGLGVSG